MRRPKVSTTVATIAGIFAILAIIVAVTWYFASLENRVRTREDHVGTLTVAPSAVAAPKAIAPGR